jgi:enolase-phosphatase E1
MLTLAAQAILLDIEGTVSSISFVHEVLFPYARARIESFLAENGSDPAVKDIAARIIEEAAALLPAGSESARSAGPTACDAAFRLMDGDVKATGLKQLQGLIWDAGYRNGELKSPLFDDVAPAIRKWISRGKRVAIYSSGSVAAQKAFLAHTNAGDLTSMLAGYFDTTTGPKRSPASYGAIAQSVSLATDQILFLSDVPQETSAAATAGMKSVLVVRPGNAPVPAEITTPRISTFDELNVV